MPFELVYCDTGSEHPDNRRFLAESEKFFGQSIAVIKNEKYQDHFDGCEKTRYINGVGGARCTVELKKVPRFRFQQPDDVQVFGYTAEEKHRANRFGHAYPEVNALYPLIEKNLTKKHCIGIVRAVGIEIPMMYRLGFNNNNCIGCVKGGMGYWNLVRKHFPERFNRMAAIERAVGRSCIKGVFLDELDSKRGDHGKEPVFACDFTCASVLADGL
jgi:hypothetical protein